MRRIPHLLALLALVVLAACGGDDVAADPPETEPEATTTSTSPTDGAEDGPITLVDGTGTEVTLDGPATAVVALEWSLAEDLLLLGLDPVGAADAAGYGEWVSDPAMPAGVEDVGTRQEPSIERIQALQPDLILGVDFRHAEVRDLLEAIAPTYFVSPYGDDGGSQLANMRDTFADVGTLTGAGDRADAVLVELDEHIAEVTDELDAAGRAGSPVAVAQGFTSQTTPTVRMFSPNALVVELLGEVGLPNAWPGEATQYGFDTVDLEGMTLLGDAELFTIAQDDDDIFTDAFAGNPVWEGMAFVERGAVHPLGGDTWTFGGPASAEVFLDRVLAALQS